MRIARESEVKTVAHRRPVVLALTATYVPGFKGGGPIRSVYNAIEALGDELCFKVLTTDRDLGDSRPYDGIEPHVWRPVGKASVMYLPPRPFTGVGLRAVLATTEYDILYLNSFFSRKFSMAPMLLRFLGQIPRKPVLLAPRGEFSAGALSLKRARKAAYLKFATMLPFYNDVVWKASSEFEQRDIFHAMGAHVRTVVAPDLPDFSFNATPSVKFKTRGTLKIAFLSRISPMKNLEYALSMLNGVSGEVHFDIYGPIEDATTWAQCQALIVKLPPNVVVRYQGSVAHQMVSSVLSEYDLFLLPTKGENFGHVILEALVAGCPVLISDRTPWVVEEHGVGWAVPLDNPQLFRAILQRCIDMEGTDYLELSQRAAVFGRQFAQQIIDQTPLRQLFPALAESLPIRG